MARHALQMKADIIMGGCGLRWMLNVVDWDEAEWLRLLGR